MPWGWRDGRPIPPWTGDEARPNVIPTRVVGLRWWAAAVLVVAALAAGSCRFSDPYLDPTGPRYAGGEARPPANTARLDTLKIVTFNVEYGRDVEGAVAVLLETPELAEPDIVLLQEMDAEGTRRVAEALEMAYVYYPAAFRIRTDQDFGNAVLSRWPIVADEKLLLPHTAIVGGGRRTATVATLDVDGRRVRVYSAHLGTIVNLSYRARANQMRTVLRDAALHPRVVLGGDLNQGKLGHFALERGYSWPTMDGPWTATVGRLDHILLKGLDPVEPEGAGTVLDNRDASDHKPVWALAVMR